MHKYLALFFSPVLRFLQRSSRARNLADRIFNRMPGLKPVLAKLLYGKAGRSHTDFSLSMGPRQQKIYEEIALRVEVERK